ncbi:MAG: inorganic phosphate transporter [Bradyrhizobium sp.]|nr:MAG: inorganic phosphate transporter [Bradyrhizobium sp.]
MDAALGLPVLVGLIAVALLFDFLNGLHDAANSIATIVSTRVLRPQFAVFWAAFFNFVAFLVFGLHVAQTIGTGIIDPAIVDAQVIFAALVGAIVWNLVTWALGIPSSSSHALIGGLFGAGVAKAGMSAAVWSGLSKTVIAIVLSPLVGFLLAMALVAIVSWASMRSTPFAVDRAFRILQFASASLYSLGHGGNDAQKTMGIIAVLLYSQGQLGGDFFVPFWVVLACQAAMAMGTLMGGWRIVRTMGLRITKLTPMQGFCAETGGAATLFMATFLGVPVSTTHTITGAIVGGWYGAFSATRNIDPVNDWRFSAAFYLLGAKTTNSGSATQEFTGLFFDAVNSASFAERNRFALYTADFDFGRSFNAGVFQVRAFSGLRAAYMRDGYDSSLHTEGGDFFNGITIADTFSWGRSSFYGIGPRIGFDYFTGSTIGLVGGLSGAVLGGYREASFTTSLSSATDGTAAPLAVSYRNQNQFSYVANLSGNIGVAWQFAPNGQLVVGYKLDQWWNARSSFDFAGLDRSEDLLIHTAFVRVTVRH